MARFFSKAAFQFLEDLRENNTREWMAQNKGRYERDLKQPFLEFIEAAGAQLPKVSKFIVADPRPVGGSLFRIHRDTRFSNDKTPYKTNAGAHFRHADGKTRPAPSYYLHIDPDYCFVAGGIYMGDSATLQSVRESIVARTKEWKVVRSRLDLAAEGALKRAPKGFEPSHPFVEDLKLKHFVTSVSLTPSEICSPKLMDRFIAECKSMTPLMKFLSSAVGVPW